MAGNRTEIIAQALVDTDIQLKVTLDSISVQKAAMKAVHGLNWEKEWNQYRASIMKRYYNLLEKRHVLILLRDNPGRNFYGQTEIIGVVNSKGKMIKRFKGWKHFRIADWSELAGTEAQRVVQLGDIKTTPAIESSIKKYKTGGVKGSFRPGSTIKEQINRERYALRKAKALKGFLMLRVQDVLTGKYHLEIIDPKNLKPSIIVKYGQVHESTLPRPVPDSPKIPPGHKGSPKASGKQSKSNPQKFNNGRTPKDPTIPKERKRPGKPKRSQVTEHTTYAHDRGINSASPTINETGTTPNNRDKPTTYREVLAEKRSQIRPVNKTPKDMIKTARKAVRNVVRSQAASASTRLAGKAAKIAVKALPIYSVISSLQSIKSVQADLNQTKIEAYAYKSSQFKSLPTGADIRREHMGNDNVDEEIAWVDSKGAITLVFLKMGKDIPESNKDRKPSVQFALALSNIHDYINSLETPGDYCQAYIKELKPLYELASKRERALISFSHDMEKSMNNKVNRFSEINVTVLFQLSQESKKTASLLSISKGEIRGYLHDYKETAQALRNERIHKTSWYNRWYKIYSEYYFKNEGISNIYPGYLNPA